MTGEAVRRSSHSATSPSLINMFCYIGLPQLVGPLYQVLSQSHFPERVSACAHCRVCAMNHSTGEQPITVFI